MRLPGAPLAVLACVLCFGESPLLAQPKTYPTKAKVVDVTQPPYNADNTGVLDAAPAINQALLDQNNAEEVVYLPAGTYRLSGKVQWGDNGMCQFPMNSTCQTKTVLAGAGADVTLLKLDDDHPDFQTTNNPRGEELITTGASAAMHFRNAIRHLTISTGSGNPAATALTFMASNHGGVSDVKIRSEDGQGKIGLNMFANEQNGPLLVQDVEVDGFDIGVNTFGNQNSITFERITVRNQNVYGVFNQQHPSFFRQLTSVNDVTAVYNQGDGGSNLTLIDADLRTASASSTAIAIINNNRRQLFVRNTTTSGYALGLQQFQNGFSLETLPDGYIDEYTTAEPIRACDNVLRSLNLPVVEAPVITYADTSTWVSIEDFGAAVDRGFGGQGSADDDTQAIQAALNSGAATVIIPSPGGPFPDRYMAYGDLVIPPSVKHIVGAKGFISGSWRFVTQAGTDPLTVEDMTIVPAFAHESARQVHFRSSVIKDYTSLPAGGSGDVFFEDVNGGPFYFHQQTVYARQLNPEIDSLNILNDGGTLWILGIKIEKKGTMVRTVNGGKTEILGAFAYATIPEEATPKPLFEVVDASLSVAGLKEITYINDAYDVKLRETRNGVTREIRDPDNVVQVDLLVAYPSEDANVGPSVTAGDDQIIVPPSMSTTLAGTVNDDAAGAGDCFATRTWTQVSGPGSSTAVFAQADNPTTSVTFPEAGTYVLRLTADDGQLSASDEVTVRVFDHYATTLDHDQDGQPSGRGADAQLFGWSNYLKNYGGAPTMIARNFTSFPLKSIVRIDRAAFPQDVETAALELEISTTNTGLIAPWTYNVFGLNDGNAGESWTEGTEDGVETGGAEVNYDNAPGFPDNTPYGGAYDPGVTNSGGVLDGETTFLGTITLREGRREKVSLASPELTAFLNADSDGQVTFLITRVESTTNSISFATKENTTFAAPRLYLDLAPAVVPVTLVRLSAKPVGDAVAVSWGSEAEIGLDRYELQRRVGRDFKTVGTAPAAGDGDYRYLDADVGPGTHYYRLRSVDADGAAEVSAVVSATVGAKEGMIAFPNPVAAGIPLTVARPGAGGWPVGEVRLLDVTGRVVQRVSAGEDDELTVPTVGLAAGAYWLEAAGERVRLVIE